MSNMASFDKVGEMNTTTEKKSRIESFHVLAILSLILFGFAVVFLLMNQKPEGEATVTITGDGKAAHINVEVTKAPDCKSGFVELQITAPDAQQFALRFYDGGTLLDERGMSEGHELTSPDKPLVIEGPAVEYGQMATIHVVALRQVTEPPTTVAVVELVRGDCTPSEEG